MNEISIDDIKREISGIDITKTPERNIELFNHTAKLLWQLSNHYSNPIDDLLQKVKDGYEKCATVPTWLSFIEGLKNLNLSFDVYLDKV